MRDILIMLLICVESDKIPLLHKLQLYKCTPVGFLINITYTADNKQVVHQDGSLLISCMWNCDHVMKVLYNIKDGKPHSPIPPSGIVAFPDPTPKKQEEGLVF